MTNRKGLSLVEILVVLIIVGILAAIALPNYSNYILQQKIQAAENNLNAMVAAQQKYYEDHATYCVTDNNLCNPSTISHDLSLSMGTDTFSYHCQNPPGILPFPSTPMHVKHQKLQAAI